MSYVYLLFFLFACNQSVTILHRKTTLARIFHDMVGSKSSLPVAEFPQGLPLCLVANSGVDLHRHLQAFVAQGLTYRLGVSPGRGGTFRSSRRKRKELGQQGEGQLCRTRSETRSGPRKEESPPASCPKSGIVTPVPGTYNNRDLASTNDRLSRTKVNSNSG